MEGEAATPNRATATKTRLVEASRAAAIAFLPWLRAHWLILLSGVLIPLVIILHDVVERRRYRLRRALRIDYWIGLTLSLAAWFLLMEAARHPRRWVRVMAVTALGTLAALGVGLQYFFRSLTKSFIMRDTLLLALEVRGAFGDLVLQNPRPFAVAIVLPAGGAIVYALLRTRLLGRLMDRPRAVSVGALVAFAVLILAPLRSDFRQAMPPDTLMMNALGGPALAALHLTPPPRVLPIGKHQALPEASPVDANAPSIVLLFGETVRRDFTCPVPSPECKLSPHLDAAAPSRIGFPHGFSTASCTELVTVSIVSGLAANANVTDLAKAPLLFDYAKARGYRTGYITSQHLNYMGLSLFLESSRIDVLREARTRTTTPDTDIGTHDEITTGEALEFLARADRPAFLMLHFSNTHAPYRQVEGYTPYVPEDRDFVVSVARANYRNSLVHHDFVVGDFLKKLRADPKTKNAIVIYAADHGEAWREHGFVGHTNNLYAEQTATPVWIDAPEGSLPAETLAKLRSDAPKRPAPTGDVSATLIDLMGGYDIPAWRENLGQLTGSSLLRDLPKDRRILMWNCPGYRRCPSPAWAIVEWPLKFQWVGSNSEYVCTDLEADPEEKHPLPLERCSTLRKLAAQAFVEP